MFGQRLIDSTKQIAFVYFKNRNANLIIVPNIERLHTFKFYRKSITDTAYLQVAEKKKPPIPLKTNFPTYGVSWEDTLYNTNDVDYMIIAFDKKGKEICKITVIWEDADEKNNDPPAN
jgi:hypothetical protein